MSKTRSFQASVLTITGLAVKSATLRPGKPGCIKISLRNGSFSDLDFFHHREELYVERGTSTAFSDQLELDIEVPPAAALSLNHVSGSWDVKVNKCRLNVILDGSGQLTAGSLQRLGAQTDSGTILARHITGTIAATVTGKGQITVEKGRADLLTAAVTGTGNINIGATVRRADLTVNDGSIHVYHVERKPTRHRLGPGQIIIDHVG